MMQKMDHSGMPLSENTMLENTGRFIMAHGSGSQIEIHASDSHQISATKLHGSAMIGDQEIVVTDAVGWNIGDKIAIAATDYDPNEFEVRTIVAISDSGRVLSLDEPLEHQHYGQVETYHDGNQQYELDMRAEVVLLTRNVVVRGDEDPNGINSGGHVMAMHGAEMRVQGAEFSSMGQEGELGRYPLHWHMLGDEGEGQYVKNSSIHGSFNKGITVHATNGTVLSGNVVVDTIGHGIYLEDGNEEDNVLISNTVFGQRASESLEVAAVISDFYMPSSFWISNPNNDLKDNTAAGSEGNGIWMTAQRSVFGESSGMEIWNNYKPYQQPIGYISGNTSHSNIEHGFAMGWDVQQNGLVKGELLHSYDDHGGLQDFLVSDLTLYKSSGDGQLSVRALGGTFEGLSAGDAWYQALLRGYQHVTDSFMVGRTENSPESVALNRSDDRDGIGLYDEAITISDSAFFNFNGDRDDVFIQRIGVSQSSTYAVENLTFTNTPEANRYSNHRNNEVWVDHLTGTASVLFDRDGSLFGVEAAFITPFIRDSVVGSIEVLERGFNAAVGAVRSADRAAWINPSETQFGVMTLAGVGDAVISKASGGSLRLKSDNSVLVVSSESEVYTLQLDGSNDHVFQLSIHLLPKDAPIQIRVIGESLPNAISGATEMFSISEVNSSNETAYFLDENEIYLKLVPVRAEHLPVNTIPELEESIFFTSVDFFFDEDTNISSSPSENSNQVDILGQEYYSDYQIELGFETDFDSENPLVFSQYENTEIRPYHYSSSNTIENTENYGLWSDPNTWGGRLPGPNDVVVISDGSKIMLDTSTEISGLLIDGNLSSLAVLDDEALSISFSTGWILINDGGLLQIGTPDDLLDTELEVILTGDSYIDEISVTSIMENLSGNSVFGVGGSTYAHKDELSVTLHGYENHEIISGRMGNDVIFGHGGNDSINGLHGDDMLYGGHGDDTILGGDGDDRLVGGAGSDTLLGEGGNDIIKGREGDNFIDGGAGHDRLLGADSGNDVVIGGDGDDLVFGLGGNDQLFGGEGDDALYGGRGEDIIDGGAGDDILRGNRDSDLLFGGTGSDRLFGGGGDDVLHGDDGRDFLLGENGNDVLDGGAGNDNLSGGNGSDTFIFNGSGYGFDRILDFEIGQDLVNFAGTGAISSFSDVQAIAVDTQYGVRFDFGNGDVLFIEGHVFSDLSQDDFIF